jgi:hypothetical protein
MGMNGQRHAPAAFTPRKGSPVPIVQDAGWAPEPVWTQRLEEKSFRLCPGIELRSPGRPSHSKTLYRLSYPAHGSSLTSVLTLPFCACLDLQGSFFRLGFNTIVTEIIRLLVVVVFFGKHGSIVQFTESSFCLFSSPSTSRGKLCNGLECGAPCVESWGEVKYAGGDRSSKLRHELHTRATCSGRFHIKFNCFSWGIWRATK